MGLYHTSVSTQRSSLCWNLTASFISPFTSWILQVNDTSKRLAEGKHNMPSSGFQVTITHISLTVWRGGSVPTRLVLPHITFTVVLCRLPSFALPQGPCCCLTCRMLWDLLRAPHQPVASTEGERRHNAWSWTAAWKDETYANRYLPKKPKQNRINKIYPAHALWNVSACRVKWQL